MTVNIYDIAKKTGLSIVTVSRVLNNYPSVRESNREKVLAAIKELNYIPNAAARTLARGKNGMIGLLTPSIFDAFMTEVISSAEKALKENGMFLAISTVSNLEDVEEIGFDKHFIGDRVDGLLIMTPLIDSNFILELKKRKIPMVILDQHMLEIKVPNITIDNFHGGYEATMSLIRGGARKIGHIAGNNIYQSSRERTAGCKKALKDSELELDNELFVEGEFTVQCGYDTTMQWIKKDILPEAVFASDDNIAFGVLDAARESGISVPQRLSIIGFDNHPFTSQFHPSMSTVKQPSEEMGRKGVEMLLEMIDQGTKKLSNIILTPSVILRDTTREIIQK